MLLDVMHLDLVLFKTECLGLVTQVGALRWCGCLVRTLGLGPWLCLCWPARSKLVVACGGLSESLGLTGPEVAETA